MILWKQKDFSGKKQRTVARRVSLCERVKDDTPEPVLLTHNVTPSCKFHLNLWYFWGPAPDGQMKTVDRFKDSLVIFSPERELAERHKRSRAFASLAILETSYAGHLAVLEPRLSNWMEATWTWLGVVNVCSWSSNISPLQITTCSPLRGDRAWSVSSQTLS